MDELDIVSLIYFAIGAVFLLPALWSLNPRHLSSTVGTLADSKKVLRRRWKHDDRKYPATACTYVYEVGGKRYRLKHAGFFARSGLMRKVTVVYLKGLPRFGHLERFPTLPMAWIGGIAMAGGILFLLMN